MLRLVQVSPDAVFAVEVLGADWGAPMERPARQGGPTQKTVVSASEATKPKPYGLGEAGEQITLL